MVSKSKVTPFFSIITCTRNSAKYLRKCLASVRDQTFTDYEHIIVDGESTDKTIELLHSFHKKYYSASPKGISNAMNIGLSHARGQYIYFLNSDDSFYGPGVLQAVHDYLTEHQELDWVFGRIHEVTGMGKTVGYPPQKRIFQGKHPTILKFYNYIPHQAVFMKKEVFDKFGVFDESLRSMMDDELWLRVAPHTKWDYMPVITANYSVRSDSQSEDKSHAADNTREYEKVQSRYLNRVELLLAQLVNKLLR